MNDGEAQALAERVMGRPPDDASRPWRLTPFPHGWIIEQARPAVTGRVMGAATWVVERESGRVLEFPSGVPRRRILQSYAAVSSRGREVTVEPPPA